LTDEARDRPPLGTSWEEQLAAAAVVMIAPKQVFLRLPSDDFHILAFLYPLVLAFDRAVAALGLDLWLLAILLAVVLGPVGALAWA